MPGYLAVDPGETTGWALFSPDGSLEGMGQIKGLDAFYRWLADECPSVDYVICEDFIVNPRKKFGGSRMIASQVIGVVRAHCLQNSIRLVLQANRYLKIGYAYAAARQPTTHADSHQWDAFAHGVYYLVKHRIRKPMMNSKQMPKGLARNDLH